MTLFSDAAPFYWNANLPAIPLRTNEKKPSLLDWTRYGLTMPTSEERGFWLDRFPNGNIGLPLGLASGLTAIDIDTEDADLIERIKAALPPSPWQRVGKKGCVLVYRWHPEQKNFKLRDDQGRMAVECLGQGNQVVLPPSIHPDTGMAYTANCNLWEVLDQVQPLGLGVKEMLTKLGSGPNNRIPNLLGI